MDNSKIPPKEFELAEKAIISGDADQLSRFLNKYRESPQIRQWYGSSGPYSIEEKNFKEDAQTIIADQHAFDTWAAFKNFKEELSGKASMVSRFEAAVDAIVTGDEYALKHLLLEDPDLIHARSVRNHHATLLNYIGANGIEGFRQSTPKNAVQITEILLNAGAVVDAVGDMYKGSTTLGLVATSIHPLKTGVQKELIDILLKYGADPNFSISKGYNEGGNLIVGCLANGRGEAAAYLSQRGAVMNLEGAAGVGNLEKVKSYFNKDGSLKDGATGKQRNAGFMWACEYGKNNIIEFLLEKGFDIATEFEGMTGLHWAVIGDEPDTVNLLLRRNAPLEIKNSYGGTVLSQALWFAYNDPKPNRLAIIETLIAAGAVIDPEWNKYIDEIRLRYS
jgi:ankyrin repeat protein